MDARRHSPTPEDVTKEAMHELPYGIYVIGTTADGKPNAMIADWVMQVSFSPRLMLVAFERDSSSLQRIRDNKWFTINLLSREGNGMVLAQGFVQPANPAKIQGRTTTSTEQVNKLDGVAYRLGEQAKGCSILDDALAFLECSAEQFVDAGDHVLVIGPVLGAARQHSGEPLTSTYTGWIYSG
jgi:flavin reductase (DIM6/NTAB) family NADH-FMN oxidoreductase RutF